MTWIVSIGLFAAICTTIAFLPQVVKTIKTKQTKDISFWMYLIFLIGLLAWLIYGILIKDLPVIIANTATFLLAGLVFIFKIKYK
ncbi:TPA: hypothetical protein DEP34_02535 [Candidatus Uhrbacteria bacterium]|uniref:MtN3 and saliva related transmembrane protein n=2 Tax=Candidatus Uhriibacteriota TaxID=1752732 RepID=A0A0G1SGB3_9BACT|nr:MAG: hypothetical protein UX45_C0019G0012 [Candidatus Uhrbacteria bacterium GW2011_GWF2_46_218]KKU41093.1 MAG: hypothetical protein UX57_C0006G0003 [Candidatus Uhrbacteria bacterium GW2011_GWE2_46_68]HBK34274.1 hypothetical protein [Candidatus Uhrbacteria bacterium]HCB19240.1 hypothetical protein [Candidatus Uhrbacteria bacterium]